MGRLKLGVLVSGRGSNLQSLIDACHQPDFPAEISIVISNKPDAYALTRADKANIPAVIIDHKKFETKEEFEDALHQSLLENQIDLVCLAGFMRVLTASFIDKWQNRIINIHPSLLPKFKGLNTHQRAIDAGEAMSGCSVHIVIPEMDAGPVILQRSVAINPDDTAESLAAKILNEEHIAYPQAVRILANQILKS